MHHQFCSDEISQSYTIEFPNLRNYCQLQLICLVILKNEAVNVLVTRSMNEVI